MYQQVVLVHIDCQGYALWYIPGTTMSKVKVSQRTYINIWVKAFDAVRRKIRRRVKVDSIDTGCELL